MKTRDWLRAQLDQLQDQDLERTLSVCPEAGGVLRDIGHRMLNLSSNDYLNLIHHPTVLQASREALEGYGTGSGSSRLISGTLPIHEEFEAAMARHKGYSAALIFGSGFLTSIGIISSFVGRDDAVFADRLIHASLVDGIVLSRARLHRFHHNDPQHLEDLLKKHDKPGRKMVVTESVFSMDGDLAPLREIAQLCQRYDAEMLVDEAHASGIFGPCGAGRVQELNLTDEVGLCMGTLSKGMGGYGGYVACSSLFRRWLINQARSFIYTTALPPAMIGAGLGALRVLHEDPGRGAKLLLRASRLRHRLQEEDLDTMQSASQIIPIVIGDNKKTLSISRRLKEQGILAVAIRPPTVPTESARLRLSVTYAHTDEDLAEAAETIIRTLREDKD